MHAVAVRVSISDTEAATRFLHEVSHKRQASSRATGCSGMTAAKALP